MTFWVRNGSVHDNVTKHLVTSSQIQITLDQTIWRPSNVSILIGMQMS